MIKDPYSTTNIQNKDKNHANTGEKKRQINIRQKQIKV